MLGVVNLGTGGGDRKKPKKPGTTTATTTTPNMPNNITVCKRGYPLAKVPRRRLVCRKLVSAW
jgi:hypothetical protein